MNQVKCRSRNSSSNLNADMDAQAKTPKTGRQRANASGKALNAKYQYLYIRYLREAKGRKEGTIRKAEDAIRRWFAYTKNKTIKVN